MNIVKSDMKVMWDVDDTLVMWNKDEHPDAVNITCPYLGDTLRLVPHRKHIKILKHHKARGYHVTVWSAGGWQWAETVVKALDLEDYVDEVCSKPLKFFDDLPASEVLGTRVYIDFKEG